MDMEKLQEAARLIIEAVGDDPNREGLVDTPRRFAEMMAEELSSVEKTNEDIAHEFNTTFTSSSDDLVVVKNIEFFSHCEHHLALMYHMKASVGYIPHGKVIGLSKIARIVDAVGKRLQIQERMGTDIRDILISILGTEDVIVAITGEHSCMTARGIKKPGSATTTITSGGCFKTSSEWKKQFMDMCR
jgi:GTP cyclohydrolase IA